MAARKSRRISPEEPQLIIAMVRHDGMFNIQVLKDDDIDATQYAAMLVDILHAVAEACNASSEDLFAMVTEDFGHPERTVLTHPESHGH